jgi:hypothetical protein
VCDHPRRGALEDAIVSGKRPYDDIGFEFDISPSTLSAHRSRCIPKLVTTHAEAVEAMHAERISDAARRVMSEAVRLQAEAERDRSLKVALLALREYARGAELLLKDNESAEKVDVTRHEQWIALRDCILGALRGHPEAERAVLAALSAQRDALRLLPQ